MVLDTPICEMCANSIWQEEDRSVGMSAYVEDCKQKSRSIEKIWERIDNSEFDVICPFFLQQYDPEWAIIRCPKCNGRNNVNEVISEVKLEAYEHRFECCECNLRFTADSPMY